MEKLIASFNNLFIHEDSQKSTLGLRLSELFPKEKVHIVSQRPWPERAGELSASEFSESKKNIFVTHYHGKFFKRCPGFKPGLSCCNYFVLNLGLQCNMNCSYCYLQSYLNTPILTLYSNISDAVEEIRSLAKSHPDLPYRVGTGETMDSLSMDPLTLYSHDLIEVFREFPKWQLELKTKSNCVDHFLERPHSGNVLVSWSINPESIIAQEEHGTATLAERFQAAEKCRQHRFAVTFHIDPIIWHPQWKANYSEMIAELCQRFDPGEMPPISMGTLRFQPEQRHIMRERFGFSSLVNRGEMFRCRDGKLRYDSDLRNEMFQFILDQFSEHDPRWKVSLCMETPESWLKSYEKTPRKVEGLGDFFRPLPSNEARHLTRF
jgi:spore photoproduct lyase